MNSIRRLSAVLLIPLLLLISCSSPALARADIKNRQYHEQKGDMIWEVPVNQKVIALTFDDGPDPTETAQILDVLQEYNAKCTFFAIGKKLPRILKWPAGSSLRDMSWPTTPTTMCISNGPSRSDR